MKCACAVISISIVCSVALSMTSVYQPGVSGSKKETFHAGRPANVTVPSRWASSIYTQ